MRGSKNPQKLADIICTGHRFRLPAEIAAGRRGFPAANEIGDLYLDFDFGQKMLYHFCNIELCLSCKLISL